MDSDPTIGAHFVTRVVELAQGKGQIKLQIWDTAGQEKYKNVTPLYYRNAVAAVCVFDITSQRTLENAESWINDLQNFAPPHIMIVLAGNKCDLYQEEEVSLEQGQEFAKLHNIEFFQQTSAKENQGINELFSRIAEKIHLNKETILAY